MSCLCCCWRQKPAEGGEEAAATAAAAEMQEVEIARAADDDDVESCNNSVEGESCDDATEDETAPEQPAPLPEVSISVPRQRRRKRTAPLTDEEAGEEKWLLEPVRGDEEDSVREAAGTLENSNCLLGPSWEEKATACYVDLLDRINEFRAAEGGLPPLRISGTLCRHARDTWLKRSKVSYGYACVPNCFVSIFTPHADTGGRTGNGEPFNCLTYWDLPYHSRQNLAAAAFHYWKTNGSYSSEAPKLPWNRDYPRRYPKPGSVARINLSGCHRLFRSILLDERSLRVGIFHGKCYRKMPNGARVYAVIALFD